MRIVRIVISFILAFIIVAGITATICFSLWKNFDPQMAPAALEYVVTEPQTKKSVKESIDILFLGDMMFDRGIRYYAQKQGNYNFIFEKVFLLLSEKDLVVANLEGPITDNKSVSITAKTETPNSYYFTFDPLIANLLYSNNVKLVSLGNNHIMNFGKDGLASTENYLETAGVEYFGSPNGQTSILKEIEGLKIAFVGFNQFGGSSEKEKVLREIQKQKTTADLVFVYCHWGEEYWNNPTSFQDQAAKDFIDAGADLVVGSHTHVIGTKDYYNGKTIYYSLGNFIFDQYFSEETKEGLGLDVVIDTKTKKIDLKETKFYLNQGGQTILAP